MSSTAAAMPAAPPLRMWVSKNPTVYSNDTISKLILALILYTIERSLNDELLNIDRRN